MDHSVFYSFYYYHVDRNFCLFVKSRHYGGYLLVLFIRNKYIVGRTNFLQLKVLPIQIKYGQYKGGENDTAKLVGKQQKETRIDYITFNDNIRLLKVLNESSQK